MNPISLLLTIVLAAFSALSLVAMAEHGYLGIWQAGLTSSASLQLLVDLVIACGLAMIWMTADARERGITVWPFLLITLAAGSFGPLLYLLRRQWTARAAGVPV